MSHTSLHQTVHPLHFFHPCMPPSTGSSGVPTSVWCWVELIQELLEGLSWVFQMYNRNAPAGISWLHPRRTQYNWVHLTFHHQLQTFLQFLSFHLWQFIILIYILQFLPFSDISLLILILKILINFCFREVQLVLASFQWWVPWTISSLISSYLGLLLSQLPDLVIFWVSLHPESIPNPRLEKGDEKHGPLWYLQPSVRHF